MYSFIAVADVSASTYFKSPFASLLSPRQLVEYTVMDIEPINQQDRRKFAGQGAVSKKARDLFYSDTDFV